MQREPAVTDLWKSHRGHRTAPGNEAVIGHARVNPRHAEAPPQWVTISQPLRRETAR